MDEYQFELAEKYSNNTVENEVYQSRKFLSEKHPDFDGVSCIECGIGIPNERLKIGRIRCVDCQEEIEFKSKLRRR